MSAKVRGSWIFVWMGLLVFGWVGCGAEDSPMPDLSADGDVQDVPKTTDETDAAPDGGPGLSYQLSQNGPIDVVRYDFSDVDQILETNVDTMGGGGGLILIQGGKVVYRKTFGVSPHQGEGAFLPNTVVALASASKWISGGVITAVVENTDLEFETTAGELIDYYYEDIWDYPKWEMTVENLFTHTHGMNESPAIHRDRSLPSMEEAARQIFYQNPMEYAAGDGLWYAGVGMQVAGRMAEIASEEVSWSDLYELYIAGPLGMNGSDYLGYPGGGYGRPTENPDVGGSVRISLNDYAKYVWMLYNGGSFGPKRVLAEESVEKMLTCYSCGLSEEQIYDAPLAAMAEHDPELVNWRTGIGSWVLTDPETGEVIEASSGGAWGCNPFIDRTRDLVGVLLPYNDARGHETNPMNVLYYAELRPAIRAAIDNPL